MVQYHRGWISVGGLMTPSFLIRSLAVSLILCLLLVGGIASAQSITHEPQHAHHQKSEHGTVFCSWMCAAGQVLDGVQIVPQIHFNVLALSSPETVRLISGLPLESPTSRGPPVFSV